VKQKRIADDANTEEGKNMFGAILATVVGLLLVGVGVVALGWLLWWLWHRREEKAAAPAIEIKPEAPAVEAEALAAEVEAEERTVEVKALAVEVESAPDVEVEAPTVVEMPTPPAPDDLKRIEGIGPKISSVLNAAGITTFAQLADTDVDRLRQILEEADPRLLRLADPTTWPDQASLAAAGQWDALDALRKDLKGGRRG
jgi:predicted flap endonuclease-1-like 5' DNA nuclease